MLERIGMWSVLFGIAVLVISAIATVTLDNFSFIEQIVIGIAAAGFIMLIVSVVRGRLKERAEEKLEGIKP